MMVILVVYMCSIVVFDYGLCYIQCLVGLEYIVFGVCDGGWLVIIELGFFGFMLVLLDFDFDDVFVCLCSMFVYGDVGGLVVVKCNDDGSCNLVGGSDVIWFSDIDWLIG